MTKQPFKKLKNETLAILVSALAAGLMIFILFWLGQLGAGFAAIWLGMQILGRTLSASSYFARPVDMITLERYGRTRNLLNLLVGDDLTPNPRLKKFAGHRFEDGLIFLGAILGISLSVTLLVLGGGGILAHVPGALNINSSIANQILFILTAGGLAASSFGRIARTHDATHSPSYSWFKQTFNISAYNLSIILSLILTAVLTIAFLAFPPAVPIFSLLSGIGILKIGFSTLFIASGIISGLHYIGKAIDLINSPRAVMAGKPFIDLKNAENKGLLIGLMLGVAFLMIVSSSVTGGLGALVMVPFLPAVFQMPFTIVSTLGLVTGMVVRLCRYLDDRQKTVPDPASAPTLSRGQANSSSAILECLLSEPHFTPRAAIKKSTPQQRNEKLMQRPVPDTHQFQEELSEYNVSPSSSSLSALNKHGTFANNQQQPSQVPTYISNSSSPQWQLPPTPTPSAPPFSLTNSHY